MCSLEISRIDGYPSRVRMGRGSDETGLPYIWAGAVMQKPRINAKTGKVLLCHRPSDQRTNWRTDQLKQSNNQSTKQPTKQPTNQPTNLLAHQPTDKRADQPTNWTIDWPTYRLTDRLIEWPTDRHSNKNFLIDKTRQKRQKGQKRGKRDVGWRCCCGFCARLWLCPSLARKYIQTYPFFSPFSSFFFFWWPLMAFDRGWHNHKK